MANLNRIRVALTGFPGAPGVSTFYTSGSPIFMTDALHGFYEGFKGIIPDNVTISCEPTGDIIDPLNGNLMGTWTGGTVTPTVGIDAAAYSAPAGGTVIWYTGSVLDGHRLKGKTFLVPLGSSAYDTDGTLAFAVRGGIKAAADNLIINGGPQNFCVWHRPKYSAGIGPARVLLRAGGYAPVTACSVSVKSAVLRSRRD